MKYFLTFIAAGLMCLGGCKQSQESAWQSKYSDCKVLAALMKKESSSFFKVPDCEQIPKLCAKDPKDLACVAELKKYFRK